MRRSLLILCALLLGHTAAAAEPRPLCGASLLPRPGVRPQPAARVQFTRPFEVGDRLTVPAFSFRLVGGGHYQTTTTCRLVSQHCYLFVEDVVWGTSRVTQTGLESLARAFDRATPEDANRGIFQITTTLFGPPPNSDGDPRILIVILDILDSGSITGETFVGYFDTGNQAPPTSREIVYIDSSPLDIGSDLARATLAHEFQHMLHWRADPDEDKWLDEGCSEYAELACGYKDTTQATASDFLQGITNTGLTLWEDLPFEFDQVFLWMTYFAERYGDRAVTRLVSDPENGIPAVDRTLEFLGVSERFETLFADWTAAVYLDGPGKLGYRRLDLGPVKRDTLAVPTLQGSRNLHLWGTDYLDLEDAPGLFVEIGSSGNSGLLAVLITDRNGAPAAASFSIPPGSRKRFNAFGPDTRALAISRTSGETLAYTFTLAPLDGASPAASDFDGDGRIGFEDFLAFADHFGLETGAIGFDPTYDLDGDRQVAFSDFLIFVGNFDASP